MPYARPSLTQLQNQAIQDITTSGVPGLDGLLRNSVLRVLAWCMSGLAYALYGFLDWISREAVPFTATDEFLEAWAALIGVYRIDATTASGTAQFTGSPAIEVRQGATLTRQDGTTYTSTASAVSDSSGVVLVPMTAAAPGAIGNCDAGTAISLDSPPPGINAGGVTVGVTDGGTDQETQEALRTRMLRQYAAPPHGGSAEDYIEWATAQPGCTRAWVAPQGMGPGSVVVYVMFDAVNAASGGFPIGTDGGATLETRIMAATGDQLLVADTIWPKEPVTALVYVAAPTSLPIDVVLADLSPNTPEQLAAITASINDMLLQTAEVAGTIYPSDIYQAILMTPGTVHFVVTAPDAPVTAGIGELPVLGTLTSP